MHTEGVRLETQFTFTSTFDVLDVSGVFYISILLALGLGPKPLKYLAWDRPPPRPGILLASDPPGPPPKIIYIYIVS